MSNKYAFATLVTSDHYLPGALALAAALKEVHSPSNAQEVPFNTACIVTPETVDVKTIKLLRRAFDVVVGVEVIEEKNEAGLKLLGKYSLIISLLALLPSVLSLRRMKIVLPSRIIGAQRRLSLVPYGAGRH